MTTTYFYNYSATKHNDYNKFGCGTISIEDKTDDLSVFAAVMDMAKAKYPDADDINIKALNLI